jgi:hypothetical protein
MDDIARQFMKRLAVEEDKLISQCSIDHIGLGLLTAIKEFGYYYYNLVRHEADDETAHHFQIMRLGLPRVISAVLGSIPCFKHPVVTFRSDNLLIVGALDQVASFGFVEEGKRLAQAALAGECKISKVSEQQFDVVLPDIVFNMEQHEASVENHYIRHQKKIIDDAVEDMLGKTRTSDHIDTLLSECVFVFRDHFIGYHAHPDLDDFFFGMAHLELQNQSGYDTYNFRTEFGGITIQKYTLAITFFLAIALRHERFAAALIKKAPQIRLRDILTVTADKQERENTLVEALNRYGPSFEGYTTLTPVEAKTIIKVLSVRRDNIKILASTMPSLPFLIEFSDSAWIDSLAAVQTGAMEFLLNSLRFNFPIDYDRNQQLREGSMQRALERLIGGYKAGLKFVQNVKIRKDGKNITDIDLAVIDEAGGDTILFQLKHQDHYGADMKRRSNRAARLKKEVDHWLVSVRDWVGRTNSAEFASAMQVKVSNRPMRIFHVIVAKHFAHFLSTADLRDDAAYATWVQFYDAMNHVETAGRPRNLAELFATLQRFMSHRMAKGFEPDEIIHYHLPELSFRIRPASAAGHMGDT